eukprot:357583-Chlamydomonas_euryale.AAC.3
MQPTEQRGEARKAGGGKQRGRDDTGRRRGWGVEAPTQGGMFPRLFLPVLYQLLMGLKQIEQAHKLPKGTSQHLK